jgi:NMD protein affecting ribosome stability and mRNA decay
VKARAAVPVRRAVSMALYERRILAERELEVRACVVCGHVRAIGGWAEEGDAASVLHIVPLNVNSQSIPQ